MNEFNTIRLPDKVVEEGFDDYMAKIDLPRVAFNSLKSDFVSAFQSGDSKNIQESFVKNLKNVYFSWPEYDKFESYFSDTDQFPYMWKRESYYADRRISLLEHSVLMNVYSLLNFKQNSEILLSYDRHRWAPRFFKLNCPVENHFRDQWYQGKLTGRPPFFPGDRNSIMLARIAYKFPYDEKYKDYPELPATEEEWKILVERYLSCG
ncbi:MAG TPA: hypothetical protein PKD41_10525 [Solidesulfovibrio sp.]|nr:hypothetical protein [Solidesulfovibrio sp.]